MTESELKSCPFCSGSALLCYPKTSVQHFHMLCSMCGAHGPSAHNRADAMTLWERRFGPQSLPLPITPTTYHIKLYGANHTLCGVPLWRIGMDIASLMCNIKPTDSICPDCQRIKTYNFLPTQPKGEQDEETLP